MTSLSLRVFSDVSVYNYNKNGFDCADLLVLVQSKFFGRLLDLPENRTVARRALLDLLHKHVVPTNTPQDGDLVLMREFGRYKPDHVGTWFDLNGLPCVLHTTERTGTALTKIRSLNDFGLSLEGTYTWKPHC